MGMKIWVVEHGEYSAYEVVGVYTTEEAAIAYAKKANAAPDYYEYKVSEWEADVPRAADVRYCASTRVVNGVIDHADDHVEHTSSYNGFDYWSYLRRRIGRVSIDPYVRLFAVGDTPEGAAKAANERAARVAAEWDVRLADAIASGALP